MTTAAVEGAVFHRSAVAELARPALDLVLDDGLLALVRRDLIRPDAPDFSGEEAYRFRHVLIRDAAYRSLSKNARADLHERFAAWLEMKPREHLREFEEIVGYHLEQAFQYRVALGSRDSRAASLAAQAAARLEAAARRALARSHLSAAIALLQRVCVLLPTDDSRQRTLLPELAAALIECGRLAEAEGVLGEAEQLAAAANDERAASHVLVQQQLLRLLHVEEGGIEEAARATALGDPGIRALQGQPRLVPRAAARSMALLERGARRGGSGGVGTRGRARSACGRSASVQRDPDVDRVLAMVRSDTGRRRNSPLRADARGGP